MKIKVDFREKASGIIELLREEEISLEIGKLPYGDYIINEAITIERKTARDFLISIVDGRLFNQISNLKKKCIHPLLLIEGNPFETDLQFDPLAIKGALIDPGHLVHSYCLIRIHPGNKKYLFDDGPARRNLFRCDTSPRGISAKAIKIQAIVYPPRTSSSNGRLWPGGFWIILVLFRK